MPIRKNYPVRYVPKGLADAYDSTDMFPGCMRTLQNLIFDQSNPELVISRPGVGSALTTFTPTYTSPLFVSVMIVIGTTVYGMVALNAGYDAPFAFNTLTNTFITVSSWTSSNCPTSQSQTGAWTPPTMAVVSTKIIVAHSGFPGTSSHYFGVIDITTPSSPSWSSVNTATNALPSVPTVVANFNNRAYFACGSVVYYSDVLAPTTMSNSTNSITIGDTTAVTAMVGLPVTTTSAGVVATLMVFKAFSIWQVSGDLSLSNLAENYISLNIGTSSPRSCVQTPIGLLFISSDGPYMVDPLGLVHPISYTPNEDSDVKAPFVNATNPSHIAAGFTGSIYRVCVDTVLNGNPQTNDYWFDTTKKRWTGPHTWPVDCVANVGNYFVISHQSKGAALWSSPCIPSTTTTYEDNGLPVICMSETATFPKQNPMSMKQMIESTIELANTGESLAYQINAIDDQRNILASVNILVTGGGIWANNNWLDGSLWSSSILAPATYPIDWPNPIVFLKLAIQIQVSGSVEMKIGSFFGRWQDAGYTIVGG